MFLDVSRQKGVADLRMSAALLALQGMRIGRSDGILTEWFTRCAA